MTEITERLKEAAKLAYLAGWGDGFGECRDQEYGRPAGETDRTAEEMFEEWFYTSPTMESEHG